MNLTPLQLHYLNLQVWNILDLRPCILLVKNVKLRSERHYF